MLRSERKHLLAIARSGAPRRVAPLLRARLVLRSPARLGSLLALRAGMRQRALVVAPRLATRAGRHDSGLVEVAARAADHALTRRYGVRGVRATGHVPVLATPFSYTSRNVRRGRLANSCRFSG